MKFTRRIWAGLLVVLVLSASVGQVSAAYWEEDFTDPVSGWTPVLYGTGISMSPSGGAMNFGATIVDGTFGAAGYGASVLEDSAFTPLEDTEVTTVVRMGGASAAGQTGTINDLYCGPIIRAQYNTHFLVDGKGYVYNISGYKEGAGQAGLYRLDPGATDTELELTPLLSVVDLTGDIYIKLSVRTNGDGNNLLRGTMSLNSDFSSPFHEIEYIDDAAEKIVGPGRVGFTGFNAEDGAMSPCWGTFDDLVVNEVIAIPGDANLDDVVDASDAALLAANWLQSGANWGMGDFNDDQVVDAEDATILAANWQTGSTAAVPEPGALMLVIGGLVLLVCRRRK